MIVDVFSQPYELLVMLYGGLLTGLVYELLRFFRCLDPELTWGMDVLSFASGGYIFIRSLLTATYGMPVGTHWPGSEPVWGWPDWAFGGCLQKSVKKSTKTSTLPGRNLLY